MDNPAPAARTPIKHELPVSPEFWRLRHRDVEGVRPQPGPKGGIAIPLPVSSVPDPHATDPWLGYVMGEYKSNLLTHAIAKPIVGTHLVYQFEFICDPHVTFCFMSDPNNYNGQMPAAFHPMLKSEEWLFNGWPDRWWCKQPFVLKPTNGLILLDVSLDPSNWSDVDGTSADTSPYTIAAFQAVLARPSYYGMTFGGGNFYGHGVKAYGGPAVMNFYQMYSY